MSDWKEYKLGEHSIMEELTKMESLKLQEHLL